MNDMDYVTVVKGSRSANGYQRDSGVYYHAVPESEAGEGSFAKALCGTKPSGRSYTDGGRGLFTVAEHISSSYMPLLFCLCS